MYLLICRLQRQFKVGDDFNKEWGGIEVGSVVLILEVG